MERTGSRVWSPEVERSSGAGGANKKFKTGSVINIELGSDSDEDSGTNRRSGGGGGLSSSKQRDKDTFKFKVNPVEKEDKVLPGPNNVFGANAEDEDEDEDPSEKNKNAYKSESKSSANDSDEVEVVEVVSEDKHQRTSEYGSVQRNSTDFHGQEAGSGRSSSNGSYARNFDKMNPVNPGMNPAMNFERGGSRDHLMRNMEPGYSNMPRDPTFGSEYMRMGENQPRLGSGTLNPAPFNPLPGTGEGLRNYGNPSSNVWEGSQYPGGRY